MRVPPSAWVAHNALAFAFRDRYPVSPGHTLVVTQRLVRTWFEATRDEQLAVLELVDEVKAQLDAERRPEGYNVGFNAGEAAGQTVFHLHVHVIPRYAGDVPDPRGGVRLAIPHKGNYLRTPAPPLSQGGPEDPFLTHLRPLFRGAQVVSILAAFAQESGLERIDALLLAALARGATVRVLTGDYLHITQERALRRLLDLVEATADGEEDDPSRLPGTLEARVVETARLPAGSRSFHPKAWRFEGPGFGTAFVGSSNLSWSALTHGVEWNLRLERDAQPAAWQAVVEGYQRWWDRGRALDEAWLARYRERAAQATPLPLPLGEEDAEPLAGPPTPRPIQEQALDALERSRSCGRARALVVLATGLGKTYLAAFDVAQVEQARRAAGEQAPRVLFLAHQAQLLRQAARTFRRVLPEASFGWFQGAQARLDAQVVFASVQKLSRPQHLERIDPRAFDYVVIDEVHHAAAPSYRRILDRLEPDFLLGLTATPDRADEADLLGLFDDHEAYRADLGRGIRDEALVPFHYFGQADTIDYAPASIPWRNRRFDPAELARAAQTQARMERLWRAWGEHPGTRTLVFCCTIAHASFARDWLREQGARVEAVHTGEGAIDRDEGLASLGRGELDALCAVDLFNEGIDLPAVDRVVFLRPTESPVVFLQQLGRGLRTSPATGKTALTVIDFVGNHRVFLERVRTLLSLGERATTVREFLARDQAPELPPGCSVQIELEAKDLLRQLLPRSDHNELVRVYRELREGRDQRPTVGELYRLGLNPARSLKGGWVAFLADEGDLSAEEQAAFARCGEWLLELEKTSMTKSYKMVTLQVLLEQEALFTGLGLEELARRARYTLTRQPELVRDLEGVKELADPPVSEARWLAYWTKNPVKHWAKGRWFRVQEERLVSRLPALEAPAAAALAALTAELVDLRLAQYRRRRREDTEGLAFEAKVISNKRDPILKLPDRARRPDLLEGEVQVRLPRGDAWLFRFKKIACNVARPVGTQRNALPDLLRTWFGVSAGRPGTDFRVRFAPSPDGWWVEPLGSRAAELPRGALMAYPSLQAAAGAAAAPLAPG
ncbi:MAG: DEAD/DEAH box helicase family protein, partial [Planctomycetes bacterium]|nr:DEAD/DEAH box helicase family protein [Planctomycetota bacterium]